MPPVFPARGGQETGPRPTDRGKLGSKRHIVVDGITARTARRGVDSKERLARHRWVVERTHARFAGFGKLRIRFARRLDIYVALLSLAAAVICSRFVDDLC